MTQGISPATTLDDGIVATAESCLAAVGAAREAIHGVIFGQEKVVDLALVTILAGGHGRDVLVEILARRREDLARMRGVRSVRRVSATGERGASERRSWECLRREEEVAAGEGCGCNSKLRESNHCHEAC